MAAKLHNVDNARLVANILRDEYGLKHHQIAGIIGHFNVESYLNPAEDRGDKGTAHGFAQWRESRFEALKAFAQDRGEEWHDGVTQVHFMMHELAATEGKAWQALKEAKTVEQATNAFMHFERPLGYKTDDYTQMAGYEKRHEAAELAYNLKEELYAKELSPAQSLRPQMRPQPEVSEPTEQEPSAQEPSEGEMLYAFAEIKQPYESANQRYGEIRENWHAMLEKRSENIQFSQVAGVVLLTESERGMEMQKVEFTAADERLQAGSLACLLEQSKGQWLGAMAAAGKPEGSAVDLVIKGEQAFELKDCTMEDVTLAAQQFAQAPTESTKSRS